MRSGPPSFRRRSWTAWAWLAMLAVMVRCVIAPGLMPDVRAAARPLESGRGAAARRQRVEQHAVAGADVEHRAGRRDRVQPRG